MHGEYLLYKKINSLEEKMVSNFNDINKKFNEMDTKFKEMNTKIDSLNNNVKTTNEQIQALINLMKTNFPNIQFLGLNGINSNHFEEQNEN